MDRSWANAISTTTITTTTSTRTIIKSTTATTTTTAAAATTTATAYCFSAVADQPKAHWIFYIRKSFAQHGHMGFDEQ